MTDIQIFEPEGRAIPYAVEGDGPVGLVLLASSALESGDLAVVAHYLAEEAGFHIVRIGPRDGADSADARSEDALAIIDHVGLDHTWIGGHGAAGTAARAFAASHTDRVNGLLLLAVEESDVALAPTIPVLIVQGTNDDVTPPSNGEALQATAPARASIKTVASGGHDFPTSHPIETAVIIEEYLDWD